MKLLPATNFGRLVLLIGGVLAAILIIALLVLREGWPRWSSDEWLTLFALGASGIFLYNVCFLYGMTMIQAGRGALVVALTPALVAACDWLLFGAPMSPMKAIGICLAAFGCLLVVTNGDPYRLFAGEVGLGEWLIIGCAALWAIYTFVGRRGTRSLSPLAMTFGASVTGWLMLTSAALLQGSLFAMTATTWRGWSAIAFLGLFGTALAFTWYAEAVQRIGATRGLEARGHAGEGQEQHRAPADDDRTQVHLIAAQERSHRAMHRVVRQCTEVAPGMGCGIEGRREAGGDPQRTNRSGAGHATTGGTSLVHCGAHRQHDGETGRAGRALRQELRDGLGARRSGQRLQRLLEGRLRGAHDPYWLRGRRRRGRLRAK